MFFPNERDDRKARAVTTAFSKTPIIMNHLFSNSLVNIMPIMERNVKVITSYVDFTFGPLDIK